MLIEIEKAKSSQQAVIERLIADETDNIRSAFNTFVRQVRNSTVLNKIIRYLKGDNIREALNVITDYVTEFASVLSNAFINSARTEVNIARRASGDFATALNEAKFVFDPGDSTTAGIMRRSELKFIREFSREQRDATRSALQQALQLGENPIQAARRFKDSIGLTRYQLNAVDNYRSLLQRGSVDALNRQLRDLRFDGTVTRAINQDTVLSQGQIDRMVERYSQKMLNYRANTIARTEMMRTLSQAQHAANWQMTDSLGVDPSKVERTWIATMDSRVRETHEGMHRQKVVGMDTPFVSPSGAKLMHPHDPKAPAAETIQCRCRVVILVPSNALPKQYDVVKVWSDYARERALEVRRSHHAGRTIYHYTNHEGAARLKSGEAIRETENGLYGRAAYLTENENDPGARSTSVRIDYEVQLGANVLELKGAGSAVDNWFLPRATPDELKTENLSSTLRRNGYDALRLEKPLGQTHWMVANSSSIKVKVK